VVTFDSNLRLSGWFGRGDGINLLTVPGMRIRAASRFCSAILADLDMRGSAISVSRLAGIVSLSAFLRLFWFIVS
jgi:hypothetical protein